MSHATERINAALEGRYHIERELGAGGMATVYLAEDLKHHRKVAVKVLRPDLAATLGPERFLREIELAAQLTHPHILPLHDSGEADGFLFYVMPYIKGESLADKIEREGELPIAEAVRLLRDVVDGLAYAHAEGVVHRDIKPDNVLLSGRHAVVTDFGIAKAVSEATGRQTLTTAGVALGTPMYMAPEQAVADPHIDHRADIYAIGAMAYEMLTGRPPFIGTTPQAVLAAHVTETPEPVNKNRKTIPDALATLVMRCLEKKAADRWQSADEILPQLEALATPSGGMTPTDTAPLAVPAAPPVVRSRAYRPAAVFGGIAVLAVVGWMLIGRGGAGATLLDANTVAVLPFRVTSASMADWREGMVDYLHGKFTGEAGPRAVDPRSLMSAWRSAVPDPGNDLSLDRSLSLAAGLGAGQLLLGSVVVTGSQTTINASIHQVPTGESIADASVAGPADSILILIDRLVAQLLTLGAGESDARITGLSGSLDAVMEYLQGQQAYRQGRYLDAVNHFSAAIEEDSSFALAALGLVKAAGPAGNTNTDVMLPALDLSWDLRDRLSPRDRAMVVASNGRNWPGWTMLKESVADAEQAVELAPDDAYAWSILGTQRLRLAAYLGDSVGLVRAAAVLDSAIALDTTSLTPLEPRLQIAIRANDRARIRELTDRYVAGDAQNDFREFIEWRSELALGNEERLIQVRERLGATSQASLTQIGYWTVYNGLPLDDWIHATEQFERRAVTERAKNQAMEQRRKIAMVQGRVADALAISDSLIERGFFVEHLNRVKMSLSMLEAGFESAAVGAATWASDSLPFYEAADGDSMTRRPEDEVWGASQTRCRRELWNLSQVDTTTVAQTLAQLDSVVETRGFPVLCPLLLRAMMAAVRGEDLAVAVAELEAYLRTDYFGLATTPYVLANSVAARLHEQSGDLDGALAAIRRRGVGQPSPSLQVMFPALLREEGRLAALTGDTAGAINAYQHYLTLRTDPDPVLQPDVDAVRSALAALVGEGGR